ncbi:hypothetical protein NAEX_06308 [Nannocystis exedens]|nr:hypothetical protein NAEX_06308 [Nannocystis exedens]
MKYKRCCELGFTKADELAVIRALGRVTTESPPSELGALERRYFGALGRYGASREDLRCYTNWIYFDARLSDGSTLADAVLHTYRLGRGERTFIHMMRGSAMRLHEILTLTPQVATLRDLLTGDRVTVNAETLPRETTRSALVLARIIPRGVSGWPELGGVRFLFPNTLRDELLSHLRRGIEAFRAAHPRASALEEFKLAPLILREVWVRSSGWMGAAPLGPAATADDAAERRVQQRYQDWLDEASEHLNGVSPRVAAESTALCPRVVDLLRELDRAYEEALAHGRPAFDPSLFWEVLGLREEREGQPPEQRPHGLVALMEFLPELDDVASLLADQFRREPGHDLERTIRPEVLAEEPHFHSFMGSIVQALSDDRFDPDAANAELRRLEDLVWLLVNFELHLRKVFKVDEALSWMLGTTSLEDELGDDLRLPFASFAFVFTDRYALGLAERTLSRNPHSSLRGKLLRVLTAYVTELHLPGPRRALRVCFFADARNGVRPELFGCTLVLEPDARLVDILAEAAPGEDDAELSPLFACVPQRHLLHLVMNAILHATSVRPSSEVPRRRPRTGCVSRPTADWSLTRYGTSQATSRYRCSARSSRPASARSAASSSTVAWCAAIVAARTRTGRTRACAGSSRTGAVRARRASSSARIASSPEPGAGSCLRLRP